MSEPGKPDWPPTLPPGTLVYCESCEEKQPAIIADNDATCVDLLCGECRNILATMFRAQ